MRHAIVMLCHADLSLVERHVSFLDADFTFYIHVDRGSGISEIELSAFRERHPNVRTFRRYRVRWGGVSIVKAELFLLRKVMEDGGADFVHICSGQDYPVRSLAEIKGFFIGNEGRQFIECHPLPYIGWSGGGMWRLELYHPFDIMDCRTETRRRWYSRLLRWQRKAGVRRSLPQQYPALYGGSNWMSLSGNCARWIAEGDYRSRAFLKRLRHTFAPDEVFFQTIVMNSPFADSVVPDSKRLTVWRPGASGPETLTEADWWRIKTSDTLWARKFRRPESDTLLRMLLTRYGAEADPDPAIREQVMDRVYPTGKDALIFVTHFLSDAVLDRFMRVSRGFEPYGDAFLVFCGDIPDEGRDACARLGIRLVTVDEDDLNELGYSPIEETIIPGSNHFIMMWFFRRLPRYRRYWNVEYDVDYSGDWEDFFRTHSPRKADFIASHVRTVREAPEWYWWYTFKPVADGITHDMMVKSFNPVYRISRSALLSLDRYLSEGNEGHHEVLIPTFLKAAGFSVADFGGRGSFVEEGFEDSAYVTDGGYPTMRYRPAILSSREMTVPDKLYHPIKQPKEQ